MKFSLIVNLAEGLRKDSLRQSMKFLVNDRKIGMMNAQMLGIL
ncbi:hypothetical protein [Hydrogenovibrio sp. JE_KL2]|nr:hypothetical protein [Hydrogenovibrio sp. JE_KL2]